MEVDATCGVFVNKTYLINIALVAVLEGLNESLEKVKICRKVATFKAPLPRSPHLRASYIRCYLEEADCLIVLDSCGLNILITGKGEGLANCPSWLTDLNLGPCKFVYIFIMEGQEVYEGGAVTALNRYDLPFSPVFLLGV